MKGRPVADKILADVAEQAAALKADKGIVPGLSVVLVGDDPASATYVASKERKSAKLGFNSTTHRLPADTSEDDLMALVEELNADTTVHGILVQSPLPPHIDYNAVTLAIDPAKDVDGFHPRNVGKLVIGLDAPQPCTPAGVIEMLKYYDIETSGKEAVVVGRSPILGKPMSAMLLEANCTVTTCHSRTKDLAEHVKRADIIVGAVGKPEFIKGEWIKDGAVVVDAGYHPGGVGDIELSAVIDRCSAYTPVPGGVGPMTINTLIFQSVESAEKSLG